LAKPIKVRSLCQALWVSPANSSALRFELESAFHFQTYIQFEFECYTVADDHDSCINGYKLSTPSAEDGIVFKS
jgi:hypothetical protein